jgi:hypothetical protein
MSGPAKMVVNLTRGGNLPARRRNGFRTAVLDKAVLPKSKMVSQSWQFHTGGRQLYGISN